MVDKVKGGVKRGCVHFDTPSQTRQSLYGYIRSGELKVGRLRKDYKEKGKM